MPALVDLFPDPNNQQIPAENIWLQQDGAPPHYAGAVRDYLSQVFPGRWIGRRGPLEWPPRSPDLNPLDFFLWGHLKSTVYKERPTNLEDLKNKIREEMQRIPPDWLLNSLRAFYDRLGYCQAADGAQFEQQL